MGAGSAVSRRVSEVVGVALFATALIWLVALASYEPNDPAWFFSTGTEAPANFMGRVGAFLAELSFQLLGYGSYLLPAVIVVVGWHYFWCRAIDAAYTKVFGGALVLACTSAFMSLALGSVTVGDRSFRAGGYLGEFLAGVLADYLSRMGSIIVILTILFAAIILSTQFSFGRLFAALFAAARDGALALWAAGQNWIEERRKARQRREVIAKHVKRGTSPDVVKAAVERGKHTDGIAPRARLSTKPVVNQEDEHDEDGEEAAMRRPTAARQTPPVVQKRARTPIAPPLPLPEPEPLRGPAERRLSGYTLPPSSLLDPPKAERKVDERELMEAARLLEEKCREFSVEGAVVQIHPGPVVTTYEFKPDAGVKYSKVTGLADDLCLAMQAESVLIERIPGKSTVGIQIPNPNREPISLRELLESDTYQRSGSKLTLALGKTIHGEPYMADLATMPHLLIAGSTGTGKSVGLNAMLTSILYRATPDDVRMIMIDPKRLELGMYEEIPHLMTPVVVDPKKAANALRWAVREMEERYKTLAAVGVRNIEQYNRNVRQFIDAKELPEGATEMPRVLPFIVVVVDELADLMMVAGNEVEESIARLAQMARAVGIHLILATQRPSVDVITGLIKANLPSRISFRVASKIDSRTILDANGAEQLLGRGDMLLLPPASSQKIRLHGPYISEQESARLASFLRKQGKPVYDESITADDKKTGPEGLDFEKDDLYDEASRIVVETGQVSISYLQRKLRVGFSRAARLVDMMEAEGLISPATGGKPREVLVGRDYFEEVDAQLR
jgi:S-DNA-T family DNA segregation ATPase FtsK/SpoIIIE